MSIKKIIIGSLAATILLFIGSCFEKAPNGPSTNSTESSYGTFRIQLIPENLEDGDAAFTQMFGTIYNEPAPPEIIFQEEMVSGPIKLLKAIEPNCNPRCGLGFKCIKTDSCMPEPDPISVGNVTVEGLKYNNEKVSFTLEPPKSLVYQMVGVSLQYPPINEGDTVALHASGSESAAAFTLKVRGITPLKVLNDEIKLEDGKSITLKWVPPTISGISRIYVRINISYHGGTKGEIQGDCDDNGEVTIPGKMLDELKSYGIAGWPVVDITRRSIGVDENAKAQVAMESTVTKLLTIPGLVSCNGNPGECPADQECVDRKCQ